jgi:peptidoglycan biosynthesis protein MviN/MurJ (putative lipid II flippase)
MLSDLSAAIYGLMTVGALLAAESADSETYAETVGAVVITMLVYWLAHSYAEFASHRLKDREPARFAEFRHIMAEQVPILFGAAVPLVALLIDWAVGASLDTAVITALVTAAVMVMLIEVLAGVRAKQKGRDLILQTLFGALLGLLIIALRLVLH